MAKSIPPEVIISDNQYGTIIMSIVQPDRQDGQREIIQVIDCVS